MNVYISNYPYLDPAENGIKAKVDLSAEFSRLNLSGSKTWIKVQNLKSARSIRKYK